MIVVTGAAGFIGSCLVSRLNEANFNHVVVVDNFSVVKKENNLKGKKIKEFVDRDNLFDWLETNYEEVEFIFHLGARTDTTEYNKDVLDLYNLNYSKKIWNACCEYQIPLVYASSAVTYGSGSLGFTDEEATLPLLQPLNPYGESKHDFDKWALAQTAKPFFWAGLKLFNVYGPNEYHKGDMASAVLHAFQQIRDKGSVTLYRSHKPEVADGEQKRDFTYVKDVVEVCYFLMHHRRNSGIYNVGTGQARTFMAVALQTFEALGVAPDIQFVDTPSALHDAYQYLTEAKTNKLRSIGYDKPFYTLEEGIREYVQGYLLEGRYY
ncbi:ADP-glyceromanno-heptose 6-epimerase [Pontibacter sp. SGAir0037]|uniref:ADP-glyceromanno-heptose 6-epimerase n=1 Tax=Pontibacter sp. SGAir0037 TaxID=2571030 RepID=UPI0010CD2BB7|nr:ADP-glyceromanno-heptose 6-epimerase [Pontibacter sp. SGAir0037]QCR21030.1 ADP-glyceromanno-heptose 6-epimerase [Pontibacter sp. SGAir0037]